ncbi:hypothetical protein DEU56DRAFT_984840 [Suillus clintonianus]|uniref:uncharacterized protein n=1 Tax=Suillus clintonianus TaxID=1904413 RepID=UPI001B873C60|nr:uncharacterized protein DEU56DRAFT_984840 [Suillus clintonianus]KAG2117582.1 hypothetical protein DEU56DRAFT_984840 [Suillus clintonianus]
MPDIPIQPLTALLHRDMIATAVSNILYFIWTWTPIVVNALLSVIMTTRLHAMYGRSNKILIFLAAVLLVSTIATAVLTIIGNLGYSGGESVLSGYHMCIFRLDSGDNGLNDDKMISTAIWDILALFLAIRIVIKHFCELRQLQRGSTIGDYFTVLIRSHVLYFLVFVVMACFTLGALSPNIMHSPSLGANAYGGILCIAQGIHMCVLGPRLILSIREHNARLVASSDAETHMTSIAFQAGGDVLTGGDALTDGDV